MQVIGVTGISGAGKSTVSKKICEMKNGKYIDADSVAKALGKKRRRVLSKNNRRIWRRNSR